MNKIDLEYNSDTRDIDMRLDFHFKSGILTVTKDNYLVEANILEETGSGDSWVLGDISSNELSIKLMNEGGIFTPNNANSAYYGEIKSGVMIIPHIRVNGGAWLKIGEFYVDEWVAGVTDSFANVVAYDVLYKMFDSKPVELPVYRNVKYSSFYSDIFRDLGLVASYDEGIRNDNIPWAYMLNANAETLQKLTQSAMAICSTDKDGKIYIRKIKDNAPIVATFSEHDQIIEINAEHNIQSRYSGALVTYNSPKQSRSTEIFSASDIDLTTGRQKLGKFQFSQSAVTSIDSIVAELAGGDNMNIADIKGHSKGVELTTDEGINSRIKELTISGKHVIENKISVGEDTPDVLEIDNEFIQSRALATKFKSVLDRSRGLDLYEVSVDIRGNPTVDVGDKVKLSSPIFNLDFVGIVKRAEYTYDGALKGKLVVVSSELVGEV